MPASVYKILVCGVEVIKHFARYQKKLLKPKVKNSRKKSTKEKFAYTVVKYTVSKAVKIYDF